MCGRYGLVNPQKITQRFDLKEPVVGLKPRYNIVPSQIVPVIIQKQANCLEMVKWGLVPFWANRKDFKEGIINARAEGIDQKPSFKKPFLSQRCLIPASFFYEWQKQGEEKIPYLIRIKKHNMFALAGIYDVTKDEQGREMKTFAIVTTAPNNLMQKIHNRMPVILNPEDEGLWLDNDYKNTEKLLGLLRPYQAERMEAYPVSKAVNNPANDNQELIKPL